MQNRHQEKKLKANKIKIHRHYPVEVLKQIDDIKICRQR